MRIESSRVTKEELRDDKIQELKTKFSPAVYNKHEKTLIKIFCPEEEDRGFLRDNCGHFSVVSALSLNDYDLFEELCKNKVID